MYVKEHALDFKCQGLSRYDLSSQLRQQKLSNLTHDCHGKEVLEMATSCLYENMGKLWKLKHARL